MRLIAIIICLFIPTAAQAGMNYIVTGNKSAAPQVDTKAELTPETDKTAKIWDNYRTIIPQADQKEPQPQAAPQPAAAQTQAPPATGLTGILQDYRQNKKNQSQMHTLRFKPPAIQSTKEEE